MKKNLFYSFCSLCFVLCGMHSDAQITKQWDKRFGGSADEQLLSLQQTSDGGYILGGLSHSGGGGDKSDANRGSSDYWIVKTDALGNKLWDKTFGGSGFDRLEALQQTSDGGYILGGYSDSGISGDRSEASRGSYDYWVVKTDATGNKEWDKRFGGNSFDYLFSLMQTSDGGYILGGGSYSGLNGDKSEATQGSADYWFVKTDASGNKEWDKRYGASAIEYLYDLKQTSDGGYILGGWSNSGIGGDKSENNQGIFYDYWIIKTDALGNKQWDKRFGGSSIDLLFTLQQTFDGGYILGGYSASGISGDKTEANWDTTNATQDYWIVKTDAFGNKEWDKRFGGTAIDLFFFLQQTADNGYILGGRSRSGIDGDRSEASQGEFDQWIVKTDALGNKEWDKRFGGSSNDDLQSLQQTSDGGYIIGGFSGSGISGDKSETNRGAGDYWIVKLGSGCSFAASASSTLLSCLGGTDGTATASPSGGASPFTYLWNNGQTTQTAAGLTAGNYSVTVTDAGSCKATATATVTIYDNTILSLNLFSEGYYIGSGLMKPVMLNQSVSGATGTQTDTIYIELHDMTDPGVIVESTAVVLMTNGTAVASFSGAISCQSYWIVISHRNLIQTWSAAPVLFSTSTNYDFTTARSKVFGNNMIESEAGVWAFYTGDFNQDGNVDLLEFPDLDDGIDNGLFGYYATDLNGDGNVDIIDFPIFDINVKNGIFLHHP